MPDGPGGDADRSDQAQRMAGSSEQGRRPGVNPRRPQSQSGSRRSGARQAAQASPSAQTYHLSNPSAPQDSIHNTSSSLGGFPVPPTHYQPLPAYDPRGNYGGSYTLPPSSMTMAHSAPSFAYSHGFPHSVQGPPDPTMLPPNIHSGFPPMMSLHAGAVYSYQRHSPESSSHSFPVYAHSQVASSPTPISPGSAGAAPSTSFVQPGPYHSLPYTLSMSSSFPAYASQPFLSTSPIYQPQYAPSSYHQNFAATAESEGQGTWWYMPHRSTPQPHQYEPAQTSYQAHYPMGYSHIGRRDVEAPYSTSGPAPSSTSSAVYPVHPSRSGGVQALWNGQPVASSSPSSYTRNSPLPTPPVDPSALPVAPSKPVIERAPIRRSYHPNPPAQRSEWVMWAGNVPSDTVHDELWRFFKRLPSQSSTRSTSREKEGTSKSSDDKLYDGVSSIFLISRSNCAFVNFESEAHLLSAIERFNGVSLRPHDPRCPRLLCRVRRRDDDLKAGVGGQRGMGIHTRWVEEQEAKVDGSGITTSSVSDTAARASAEQLDPIMGAMSLSSDDDEPSDPPTKQSSSGSYASTSSSLLRRHFPKRYFILKSLTQVR